MTVKPVIPREQAVRDVEHAVDYYLDEGAAQAASDLVDALQAAYRLIGRHPGIGSPRYGYELDIPGLRGRAWRTSRIRFCMWSAPTMLMSCVSCISIATSRNCYAISIRTSGQDSSVRYVTAAEAG